MKNVGDRRDGPTGTGPQKNPRQDRLKQALRENLKRRKSQARGRGDPAIAPSPGEDASPGEGGGKKPGP
jgi:hypothetical protein